MSVVTSVFFAVKCDRCGDTYEDGSDISFWTDEDSALEYAESDDWIEKDGKNFCPGCYTCDDIDRITIKPPYPKHLNELIRFIKFIGFSPWRKEFDDRFEVQFYLRKFGNIKQLDEDYIKWILGGNLISLEYKKLEHAVNSECIIRIKK